MVKVENDRFQVLFESIGEGYNGDYDPDDPKDIELLRFTVFEKKDGEWEPIDDCSYCTLFPTNTPRNIRLAAARRRRNSVNDSLGLNLNGFKWTAQSSIPAKDALSIPQISWVEVREMGYAC